MSIRGRSFDSRDVADELGDRAHAFVECSFREAVGDDVRWAGSTFEGCDLTDVRFTDADLSETRWVRCTGERPVFGNSDLTEARFEGCDLAGARFASITAAETSWHDCKLLNATFTDLGGFGWEMRSCVLMYADLRELSFRRNVLHELDLTESDLRGADFQEASFEGCKLVRADLRGADFVGADLRGADLGPLDDPATLTALKGAIISGGQACAVANALGLVVVDGEET